LLNFFFYFSWWARKVEKEAHPATWPSASLDPLFPWRDQKLASLKQFAPLIHGSQFLSAALQWGKPRRSFDAILYSSK
jgi:hypothetical protein